MSQYFHYLCCAQYLGHGVPRQVRTELAANAAPLLAHTFDAGTPSAQLRFQGVVLVHALVKRAPDWLPAHPEVLERLLTLWSSAERKARLSSEEQAQMPLDQIKESKLIIKCFMSYCRHQAAATTNKQLIATTP